MATVAVNTAYLSTYTGFPEASIRTLTHAPTPELVTSFLEQLVLKAQDHDRLKAERLRLDVELENAVRNGDTKARAVKATAERALKEVGVLKTRLTEEGRSISLLPTCDALTILQKNRTLALLRSLGVYNPPP